MKFMDYTKIPSNFHHSMICTGHTPKANENGIRFLTTEKQQAINFILRPNDVDVNSQQRPISRHFQQYFQHLALTVDPNRE